MPPKRRKQRCLQKKTTTMLPKRRKQRCLQKEENNAASKEKKTTMLPKRRKQRCLQREENNDASTRILSNFRGNFTRNWQWTAQLRYGHSVTLRGGSGRNSCHRVHHLRHRTHRQCRKRRFEGREKGHWNSRRRGGPGKATGSLHNSHRNRGYISHQSWHELLCRLGGVDVINGHGGQCWTHWGHCWTHWGLCWWRRWSWEARRQFLKHCGSFHGGIWRESTRSGQGRCRRCRVRTFHRSDDGSGFRDGGHHILTLLAGSGGCGRLVLRNWLGQWRLDSLHRRSRIGEAIFLWLVSVSTPWRRDVWWGGCRLLVDWVVCGFSELLVDLDGVRRGRTAGGAQLALEDDWLGVLRVCDAGSLLLECHWHRGVVGTVHVWIVQWRLEWKRTGWVLRKSWYFHARTLRRGTIRGFGCFEKGIFRT